MPWSAWPSPLTRQAVTYGARVVLGGVAPVPYRARRAEEYLEGRPISQVDPPRAGSRVLPDARPMADNEYKVILANNLVKNAVTHSWELFLDGMSLCIKNPNQQL